MTTFFYYAVLSATMVFSLLFGILSLAAKIVLYPLAVLVGSVLHLLDQK